MTGEMKDALLPCPFCGRSVELQCDRRYVGPDQNFIRCGYIGCVVNPETGNHDDPAGAIASWNRRPLLSTDKAVGEFTTTELDTLAKGEIAYWCRDERELLARLVTAYRALTASRASKSQGGRNE